MACTNVILLINYMRFWRGGGYVVLLRVTMLWSSAGLLAVSMIGNDLLRWPQGIRDPDEST